jgi:O-methyltransferase involved in polyketide biosynthesis
MEHNHAAAAAAAITLDVPTRTRERSRSRSRERDAVRPPQQPSPSASPPLPSGVRTLPAVSQSCLRLAALRAEESLLSSALLVDPFAAALSGRRKPAQAHFIFRQRKTAPLGKGAPVSIAAGPENGAASASSHSPSDSGPSSLAVLRTRAAELNDARAQAPDTMIRCRYIDDVVREHCAVADDAAAGPSTGSSSVSAASLEQLVLLGCGLDSRAYRLSCLRHTAVFELDVAGVLEYKAGILATEGAQPLCAQLTRVPVDFAEMGAQPNVSKTSQRGSKAKETETDAGNDADPASPGAKDPRPPWLIALQSSGFDPRRRTLWVAEGLLMYLGPRQVANFLGWTAKVAREGMASSAPAATPNSASAGASSSPTFTLPLHNFVCDVVNEAMARSKLKWFRFFRWGCDRTLSPSPSSSPSSAASQDAAPIELFLRSCGWQINSCHGPESPAGYSFVPSAASFAVGSFAAATPSLAAPSVPRLHLHPICRDGLSYGRYTADPLLDDSSDPRKPPKRLETYMMRAHVSL